MRSKRIMIAGIEAVALRVSFTGDLGWELHCATEDQATLYTALIEAGNEIGAGPVGGRALMSLRVEKGYGSWGRDYSPEYWPQEQGLAGLVKMDKEFLNKEAYAAIADNDPRELMVVMEVHTDEHDALGGEPIFLPDGTPAGQVTSGAYGYSVEKSLAIGYLKAGTATAGDTVHVAILGGSVPATVLSEPPFDPKGERLRA